MNTIHLDSVMTKQELQMENRRLRNFIRRLGGSLSDADTLGLEGHHVCDKHIALINEFIRTFPHDELLERFESK